MAIEEKLQHFYNSAMGTVKERSDASLEEFRASLAEQYAAFETQAQHEMETKERVALAGIRKKANIDESKTTLKIRHKAARREAEMADQVFAEVADILNEYRKSDAYPALIEKYIREAKEFAGEDELIIYLDMDDAALQASLSEKTGTPLKVSSYSFGGGMRALIPSKNILIENAFSTKMAEAKETFRVTV